MLFSHFSFLQIIFFAFLLFPREREIQDQVMLPFVNLYRGTQISAENAHALF